MHKKCFLLLSGLVIGLKSKEYINKKIGERPQVEYRYGNTPMIFYKNTIIHVKWNAPQMDVKIKYYCDTIDECSIFTNRYIHEYLQSIKSPIKKRIVSFFGGLLIKNWVPLNQTDEIEEIAEQKYLDFYFCKSKFILALPNSKYNEVIPQNIIEFAVKYPFLCKYYDDGDSIRLLVCNEYETVLPKQ